MKDEKGGRIGRFYVEQRRQITLTGNVLTKSLNIGIMHEPPAIRYLARHIIGRAVEGDDAIKICHIKASRAQITRVCAHKR